MTDQSKDDEDIRMPYYKRRRPLNELEKNDDFEIEAETPTGTTTTSAVELVKPARDYYAHELSLGLVYRERIAYHVPGLRGFYRMYTPTRRHNYSYLPSRFPRDYVQPMLVPFQGYNGNVPLALATIKGAVRRYVERRLHRIRMNQYRDTVARIGFERKFKFRNPYI